MDNHEEQSKPTNHVANGLPLGAIQGEKAFMRKATEEIEKGLRQYAEESGNPDWYAEKLEFIIRHDHQGYNIGIPIYAMGSPVRGFYDAPAMLEEYAKNFGINEHEKVGRTWHKMKSNSLRDLLNVYNEGFMRKVSPQHCVDLEAIATECGYNLDQLHR